MGKALILHEIKVFVRNMDLKVYHSAADIKSIWLEFDHKAERLLASGKISPMDYSFYQSYAWNDFIERECYRGSYLLFRRKRLDYLVAFDKEKPVAIMPLIVSGSGKVEFTSWKTAGLNNAVMIPEAEKNPEACSKILEFMRQRYKGLKYRLCDIPVASPLCCVAEEIPAVEIIPRQSFRLRLSRFENYDQYKSSLSKSSRQTLRTARNHLARDGKWEFRIYKGRELTSGYLLRIWRIYYKRKKAWRGKGNASYNKVAIFLKALNAMRNVVSRSLHSLEEAGLCALEFEGNPIAFAVYYNYGGNIVVPRLAIDDSYRRYSPGLVMLDEFISQCYADGVRDFDLSRGEEDYKRRIGCEAEEIYRYKGRF